MADNKGDPRDSDPPPLQFGEVLAPMRSASQLKAGETEYEYFGAVVMARTVQTPRDPKALMARLDTLCDVFGELFYYSWEVKGKDGKKEEIYGLTIKGANALMLEYKNLRCDVRVADKGEWFEFVAQLIDYENGVTTTRPFRQRKTQNMGGKMDADRKLDIQFQIGASKCQRNIIDKTLVLYSEYMVEKSKDKLLAWVKGNLEKAKANVQRAAQSNKVVLVRLEAYVDRPEADWLPLHYAKLLQAFRAITEGAGTVDDVFGILEVKPDASGEGDLGDGKAAGDKAPSDGMGGDKGVTDPKPAGKKASDKKKPETAKEPDKKPAETKPAEEPKQTEMMGEPKMPADPPTASDADLEGDWGNLDGGDGS